MITLNMILVCVCACNCVFVYVRVFVCMCASSLRIIILYKRRIILGGCIVTMDRNTGVKEHQKELHFPLVGEFIIMLNLECVFSKKNWGHSFDMLISI